MMQQQHSSSTSTLADVVPLILPPAAVLLTDAQQQMLNELLVETEPPAKRQRVEIHSKRSSVDTLASTTSLSTLSSESHVSNVPVVLTEEQRRQQRAMRNRASAFESRQRRQQHLSQLEQRVESLASENRQLLLRLEASERRALESQQQVNQLLQLLVAQNATKTVTVQSVQIGTAQETESSSSTLDTSLNPIPDEPAVFSSSVQHSYLLPSNAPIKHYFHRTADRTAALPWAAVLSAVPKQWRALAIKGFKLSSLERSMQSGRKALSFVSKRLTTRSSLKQCQVRMSRGGLISWKKQMLTKKRHSRM